MTQVEGIVKRIFTKAWNDKTFYSIALTNQETVYGCGPFNPKVEPGDKVQFFSKTNAKGYQDLDKNTLKVTKGVEEVRSNGSVGGSTGGPAAHPATPNSYVSKDAYWSNKEARDLTNDGKREIGAARNTAIAFIDLLVKHEAIKLPAGAKREGFLVALLNDYTTKFTKGVEDVPQEAAPEKIASKVAPAEADPTAASEDWS